VEVQGGGHGESAMWVQNKVEKHKRGRSQRDLNEVKSGEILAGEKSRLGGKLW